MEAETVKKIIRARRQEGVDLLAALIRADTTNPPGNESAACRVLGEYLERHGLRHELYEEVPGRANLLCEIGSGGGPKLIVPAHTDVVPAGDGWETNPFEPVRQGEVVIGRGACDNKGPLAGACLAAVVLRQLLPQLRGTFLLAAVADEERGSKHGLEFLLREGRLQADYALVPDMPSGLATIEIAEKGLVHAEVIFRGRQAHGSTPELGRNAATAAAAFVGLIEHWTPAGPPHQYLSPSTLNVGLIQAGVAPNVVPAKATVTLDVRHVPGIEAGQILAALERTAQAVAATRADLRCEVRTIVTLPATSVPEDTPHIPALKAAIKQVTGREAKLVGVGGATVCKQLIQAGIPAIAFGPGNGEYAHTANECLAIPEMLDYAAVLVLAAEKLLG